MRAHGGATAGHLQAALHGLEVPDLRQSEANDESGCRSCAEALQSELLASFVAGREGWIFR